MKRLKWSLFALAGLVALVCLFYAEENWRGARAWEKVRKEAEARGEWFTVEQIIPLPVPDAENFVMAPGVPAMFEKKEKNAVVPFKDERLQGAFGAGFTVGKPLDFSLWEIDLKESIEDRGAGLSAEQRYLKIASNFDAGRQDLLAGVDRPSVRFQVNWLTRPAFIIEVPHMTAAIALGQLFSRQAVVLLHERKTQDAFDDIRISSRMIEGLRQEPMLIAQLVALTLQQIMLQPLWEGIKSHQWSGEQLLWFQKKLETWNWIESSRRAVGMGETTLIIDSLEWMKTASSADLKISFGIDGPVDMSVISVVPDGWIDQNKAHCLEEVRGLVNAAYPQDQPNRVDLEGLRRQEAEFEDRMAANTYSPCWILVRLTVAGISSTPKKTAEAQSWRNMAILALALERYALDHGETYPAVLEELAPKYLEVLPVDPVTGDAIHYQKTPEGRYKLWCVGLNLKNDEARLVADHHSPDRPDRKEGDWVWSYEPLVLEAAK